MTASLRSNLEVFWFTTDFYHTICIKPNPKHQYTPNHILTHIQSIDATKIAPKWLANCDAADYTLIIDRTLGLVNQATGGSLNCHG